MGVVSAALRFGGLNLTLLPWAESTGAEVLSIVMYIGLIAIFIGSIMKIKADKK